MGIDGCVVNYNTARINKAMVGGNQNATGIQTVYSITTITLGIPVTRYEKIAQRLKDSYRLRMDRQAEAERGDYIWIEGSIAGADKFGKVDHNSDEYYTKNGRHVFYAEPKTDNKGNAYVTPSALGPFINCLQSIKKSLKGVFFGNLRVKEPLSPPLRSLATDWV